MKLVLVAMLFGGCAILCVLLVAWFHRQLRAPENSKLSQPMLRVAGLVGESWLPGVEALWRRVTPAALLDALNRALRLAGEATSLDHTGWLHVLTGCGALGAAAAVLAVLMMGQADPFAIVMTALGGAACAVLMAQNWLRQQCRSRERELLRDLPVGLDLLALSLECGAALPSALELGAEHLPRGPLSFLLRQLRGDLLAGHPRADALRRQFDANQGSVVAATLGALLQADASGTSLAPSLRAQARQRTDERFAAAEKAALQAPVRMLLPLVTCIFPCTFIVIAFPLVNRFVGGGP